MVLISNMTIAFFHFQPKISKNKVTIVLSLSNLDVTLPNEKFKGADFKNDKFFLFT